MAEKNQMTDEEKILADHNIAQALLTAAEYKNVEPKKINIIREGQNMFSFTVEGISEKAWDRARRESTRNRNKRNEEFDVGRFLSHVIYEATIPEDKKKIWQEKSVWQKLNAASGVDVVNAILKPAEKQKIAELIEDMSGYNDDGLEGLIEDL